MTGKPIDDAKRLAAWRTLSDLLLDTSLDHGHYVRMAAELRTTGLAPAEIRQMLFDDIAPALIPNLTSVAGEWAGWSDEFLRREMARAADRGRAGDLGWRLRRLMARRTVTREWERLEPLLQG